RIPRPPGARPLANAGGPDRRPAGPPASAPPPRRRSPREPPRAAGARSTRRPRRGARFRFRGRASSSRRRAVDRISCSPSSRAAPAGPRCPPRPAPPAAPPAPSAPGRSGLLRPPSPRRKWRRPVGCRSWWIRRRGGRPRVVPRARDAHGRPRDRPAGCHSDRSSPPRSCRPGSRSPAPPPGPRGRGATTGERPARIRGWPSPRRNPTTPAPSLPSRPGRGSSRRRSRSRRSSSASRFVQSFEEIPGPLVAGVLGAGQGAKHAPGQPDRLLLPPEGEALDDAETQPPAFALELRLRLFEEGDGGGVELGLGIEPLEEGPGAPEGQPCGVEIPRVDRLPLPGLAPLLQPSPRLVDASLPPAARAGLLLHREIPEGPRAGGVLHHEGEEVIALAQNPLRQAEAPGPLFLVLPARDLQAVHLQAQPALRRLDPEAEPDDGLVEGPLRAPRDLQALPDLHVDPAPTEDQAPGLGLLETDARGGRVGGLARGEEEDEGKKEGGESYRDTPPGRDHPRPRGEAGGRPSAFRRHGLDREGGRPDHQALAGPPGHAPSEEH